MNIKVRFGLSVLFFVIQVTASQGDVVLSENQREALKSYNATAHPEYTTRKWFIFKKESKYSVDDMDFQSLYGMTSRYRTDIKNWAENSGALAKKSGWFRDTFVVISKQKLKNSLDLIINENNKGKEKVELNTGLLNDLMLEKKDSIITKYYGSHQMQILVGAKQLLTKFKEDVATLKTEEEKNQLIKRINEISAITNAVVDQLFVQKILFEGKEKEFDRGVSNLKLVRYYSALMLLLSGCAWWHNLSLYENKWLFGVVAITASAIAVGIFQGTNAWECNYLWRYAPGRIDKTFAMDDKYADTQIGIDEINIAALLFENLEEKLSETTKLIASTQNAPTNSPAHSATSNVQTSKRVELADDASNQQHTDQAELDPTEEE